MIKDLPVLISLLKLTLLPGEFSTKTSRAGILSPTLMKARAELWKDRDGREALRANLRRAALDAIMMVFQLAWMSVGRELLKSCELSVEWDWPAQPSHQARLASFRDRQRALCHLRRRLSLNTMTL